MADAPQKPESFEAALEQLEKIVKELENGELPLERSIELFEKGMELSEVCRKQLGEAETRVEVLLRRGGRIEAQPFQLEEGESPAR
jgi:exodeoxyribonuclease VII small subunit